MNIEEKIQNIKEPKIKETIGLLPDWEVSSSVDDFFENFVKPRLPKKEVVLKWHEILMEYVANTKELSCAVRYGNSGNGGYDKLRRGWVTQNTDDDFEYFYTDNFLSSFICKMAIDEYCPSSAGELRDVFQKHKFPYGYDFWHDSKDEAKCVVIATGDEPGFLDNYKISHVFDSGKNYNIKGVNTKIKELSEAYFNIGDRKQWEEEPDHIRKIKIGEDEKEVIIACFLRFVHPMNYFLTPSNKKHICVPSATNKDIGENPLLINKVKQYMKEQYQEVYDEFVEKIMWYDEEPSDDYNDVEIVYGNQIKTMTLDERLSIEKITLDMTIPSLEKIVEEFNKNDDTYLSLIYSYDGNSEKVIDFWKNASTKHGNKKINDVRNLIIQKVESQNEYYNADEVKVEVLLKNKN